jgi:hypothetical protein
VETKEMTDRQVLYQVELLYEKRKRQNRLYSMEKLAAEIELTRPTLFSAIRYRRASVKTINKIKQFLDNEK